MGVVRPHPIMVVRLCDFLNITPQEAFTTEVLAAPQHLRHIPPVYCVGDYRPEFNSRWAEFLEQMGWSADALREGIRGHVDVMRSLDPLCIDKTHHGVLGPCDYLKVKYSFAICPTHGEVMVTHIINPVD
jgi:hypothetical protein